MAFIHLSRSDMYTVTFDTLIYLFKYYLSQVEILIYGFDFISQHIHKYAYIMCTHNLFY